MGHVVETVEDRSTPLHERVRVVTVGGVPLANVPLLVCAALDEDCQSPVGAPVLTDAAGYAFVTVWKNIRGTLQVQRPPPVMPVPTPPDVYFKLKVHFLGAIVTDDSPTREIPSSSSLHLVSHGIFALFMPGTQAVYFQPTAGLGPFYGAGVQLAPLQISHNNDRFGPSQISTIVQVSLLRAQHVEGTMALFEIGATASLERNSSRRWLIPYFGATLGGLTQADLGASSYAYALGGLHLYWHHNLMIDAEGGYHFPFEDIDRVKGPRAQLSARFSLW